MSQGPLCTNLSQKVQKEVSQIANCNLPSVILLGGLSVNLNHLKTTILPYMYFFVYISFKMKVCFIHVHIIYSLIHYLFFSSPYSYGSELNVYNTSSNSTKIYEINDIFTAILCHGHTFHLPDMMCPAKSCCRLHFLDIFFI